MNHDWQYMSVHDFNENWDHFKCIKCGAFKHVGQADKFQVEYLFHMFGSNIVYSGNYIIDIQTDIKSCNEIIMENILI